jgi:hypothetical protein
LQVVQANCEPHKKSIGCHHSLKESINNQFMQDRERLLDLLQALGQLVENYSGKNNAQDALQLLGILKVRDIIIIYCQIMIRNFFQAISCTDIGSELITHHPQIMVWLFDKFCMQDLMINNNREGEMVDLILSILQRCTRKYQVQIYDSWLKRVTFLMFKSET